MSLRIAAVKHPVRDSRQRLENDGAGLDTGDGSQVSPGNQIGGGLSRTEANRHKLAVAVSDSGICEDGDGLALPQSFCVRPIVELKLQSRPTAWHARRDQLAKALRLRAFIQQSLSHKINQRVKLLLAQ